MRSAAWTPPRRRKAPRLGLVELTYHAIDSYLNRHPSPDRAAAVAHLDDLCRGARFVRRRPTGEEEWRADGCRLIVHRIARRPPIVLTVLPLEGVKP